MYLSGLMGVQLLVYSANWSAVTNTTDRSLRLLRLLLTDAPLAEGGGGGKGLPLPPLLPLPCEGWGCAEESEDAERASVRDSTELARA